MSHPSATIVKSAQQASFLLYTYYRSSCSGRLRIALNLKELAYDRYLVDRQNDEHRSEKWLRDLNPNGTMPVLVDLRPGSDGASFPIAQSVAAMEYLEEALPDSTPLLPPLSKPLERAKSRTLVNLIASDVQAVASGRVAKTVASYGKPQNEWMHENLTKGLQTYEKMAAKTAGKYSVGDEVTMADVCLVPAVWNAEHFNVDLEQMPTVSRIFKAVSELDAVKDAHWSAQPDCPADKSWA